MKKLLKVLASVAVVTSVLTSAASAATLENVFAGYDTTTPGSYHKLFNVFADGKPTSKWFSEPVKDEDVEWVLEGYELAYPHAGYERLYLEGNKQNNITRLVPLYPQWETRFQDFMWELYGDHKIWQRQQTKINNSFWAWDFGNEALGVSDFEVFVPTNRYADVEVTWQAAGIMNLDNEGNFVFDQEGRVYNELLYANYDRFLNIDFDGEVELMDYDLDVFKVKPLIDKDGNIVYDKEGKKVLTKEIEVGTFFHAANLSDRNDYDNQYVVTDEEIAAKLDIPYLKVLTGPTYHGEPATKIPAVEYFNGGCNNKWQWDADTVNLYIYDELDIRIVPTVAWSEVKYELADPHEYYQYLIVNGLVLDGRNDTPRVFRYIGGKADPKVEWRHCFIEAAYPHQVVEIKYIENNEGEMVVALDENLKPYLRMPTGAYADSYFVVTDTHIQLWVTDGTHKEMVAEWSRTEGPFGDYIDGYYPGATYLY